MTFPLPQLVITPMTPTGEASREEINNSTAHIILFIVVMLMYGCLIILMSVLLDYFDVCFAPLNYQLLKT